MRRISSGSSPRVRTILSPCTNDTDSTPPPTAICMPSSMISFAAVAIAIMPDEHCRSIDIAGTLSGNPALNALCRATLNPCVPCWIAAPRITSSISPGSTRARLTASAIACPARACGWVSLKAPRNALPIGVRAVETMTAWRMGRLLRSGGRIGSPALRSADPTRSRGSPSATRAASGAGSMTRSMNRGGRVLDDEADFADRLRHRLADQVEAGQLFDPLPPQRDLVEAQHEAEQPAGVDQAEQDDIARIRDLIGQDQLA